jgi:hypothetical protein
MASVIVHAIHACHCKDALVFELRCRKAVSVGIPEAFAPCLHSCPFLFLHTSPSFAPTHISRCVLSSSRRTTACEVRPWGACICVAPTIVIAACVARSFGHAVVAIWLGQCGWQAHRNDNMNHILVARPLFCFELVLDVVCNLFRPGGRVVRVVVRASKLALEHVADDVLCFWLFEFLCIARLYLKGGLPLLHCHVVMRAALQMDTDRSPPRSSGQGQQARTCLNAESIQLQ